MTNLNLTDKQEILSTIATGENGIKVSVSENTVKAFVRYFKQAILDIRASKKDAEIVADITKSINKKLEFVRDNFTEDQQKEILVLFTDSKQGKKVINEGLCGFLKENKNNMIFMAWFDKYNDFKIGVRLDNYSISSVKVLKRRHW